MIAKLKPASPGLVVRDPANGQPLPAEGKNVPMTTHWRRRLKRKEVVLVPKATAAKKSSQKES